MIPGFVRQNNSHPGEPGSATLLQTDIVFATVPERVDRAQVWAGQRSRAVCPLPGSSSREL